MASGDYDLANLWHPCRQLMGFGKVPERDIVSGINARTSVGYIYSYPNF